ncbi:Nif11-like leader peptide family natural product [Hyella patelloides LEGE 07179]|uniref:Nif11-like leader peptide family natural product n=1 Tax=Hyella patelloides LEGE 07179 TaxID=945734 RepID=A0A563W4I5_9CYAN|nr:Nif11-like leader peptide family natural product precursor [Hyella patelloides]VEP18557.1 Nif11-like leader peptide family natural product [Hyella patelloides LEGE 07179]
MTIANVEAFYKRLAVDEAFRSKIQKAGSKQKCRQIVREAGYDFTQEEFEAFTSQLLDSNTEVNLGELSEIELEAAVGGINALFQENRINFVPPYGLPPDWVP